MFAAGETALGAGVRPALGAGVRPSLGAGPMFCSA